MEQETQQLLRQMEERLARMEAAQQATRRRTRTVLLAAAAGLAVLVLWLAPQVCRRVRQYDRTMTGLQQVSEQLSALDLQAAARALSALDGVDMEALEQASRQLQALDVESLQSSLALLQSVDLDALNKSIQQVQQVISGLDAESINEAVQNLNRALEPLLRLFA